MSETCRSLWLTQKMNSAIKQGIGMCTKKGQRFAKLNSGVRNSHTCCDSLLSVCTFSTFSAYESTRESGRQAYLSAQKEQ